MSPRPSIFVSAASAELRSARQLVANSLQYLGHEAVWQDIFGSEQGDLRGMLRQKLDGCQGVIQLVGKRYGAEPPTVDPSWGRVSYTQYEALYAKGRGKKVWYLLIEDTFPTDDAPAEPQELRDLQAAYRRRIEADKEVYYPLASQQALEINVLKMRDELAGLRRSARRYAFVLLALLIVLCGAAAWIVRNQHAQAADSEKQGRQVTAAVEGNNVEIKNLTSELARVRTTEGGKGFGNLPAARQEELNRQVAAIGVDKALERSRAVVLPPKLAASDTAELNKIITDFQAGQFADWPALKTAANAAATRLADHARDRAGEQRTLDDRIKTAQHDFESCLLAIEKLQDTFRQTYEERVVLKAIADDLTPRIAREETRLKELDGKGDEGRGNALGKISDLYVVLSDKAQPIAEEIRKAGDEESKRLHQRLLEEIRAGRRTTAEERDAVNKPRQEATEQAGAILMQTATLISEWQRQIEEAGDSIEVPAAFQTAH